MNFLYENYEIEDMLITNVLHDNKIFYDVSFLTQEDFQNEHNKIIWKAILSVAKNNNAIDFATVYGIIEDTKNVDVANRLKFLYMEGFINKGIDFLAIAKRLRMKRIEGEFYSNTPISKIKTLFADLDRKKNVAKAIHIKDAINSWITYIQQPNCDAIKSGYKILDYAIGGFNKTDLIVLSARPSVGKTTFALNLSLNIAKRKKKTVFVNLEMSVNSIISKIMAMETLINTNVFRDKTFEEKEIKRILQAGQKLTEENTPELILVDAGSITIPDIRTILSEIKDVDFLVVDQLTKIKNLHKRDRRDLEIAELTFGLKELAKEFNIPILLLHQLSRGVESRQNKIPVLSDLRDSGAVEQDADVVMFLYRPAYYSADENDNRLLVYIAKNKMGLTGMIGYRYNLSNSLIWEVSREEFDEQFADLKNA